MQKFSNDECVTCSVTTYDVGSDCDAGYSDADYKTKSNVDVEVGGEGNSYTKQELQSQ